MGWEGEPGEGVGQGVLAGGWDRIMGGCLVVPHTKLRIPNDGGWCSEIRGHQRG